MNSAVYVLGMHRSGTSAVTRLVNLLGLPVAAADDLMPPTRANPRGYWESSSLTDMNDRILAALGASWSTPPVFVPGWENDERLEELAKEARTLFARVHSEPQWVWKDPRTSLTFAFWRRVIAVNPVLVLTHRHPHEVIRSLNRAQPEVNLTVSLALWERYNRVALAVAAGHPTFVIGFERLVSDPQTTAASLETFLRASGLHLTDSPRSAADASIDATLHRSRRSATSAGHVLSTAQEDLLRALTALEGPHGALAPPDLVPETPWVEPLFVERRRVLELERDKRQSIRFASVEPRWGFLGVEVQLRPGSKAWRVFHRVRAAAPRLRSRGV
jgi:hypothetical protein